MDTTLNALLGGLVGSIFVTIYSHWRSDRDEHLKIKNFCFLLMREVAFHDTFFTLETLRSPEELNRFIQNLNLTTWENLQLHLYSMESQDFCKIACHYLNMAAIKELSECPGPSSITNDLFQRYRLELHEALIILKKKTS